MLTMSPMTSAALSDEGSSSTTASPVFTPTRTCELGTGHRLVQGGHRDRDLEGRADGPLGVVPLRDGSTEYRHHRVADELLDRPPKRSISSLTRS